MKEENILDVEGLREESSNINGLTAFKMVIGGIPFRLQSRK
jgi:hypothetical protein